MKNPEVPKLRYNSKFKPRFNEHIKRYAAMKKQIEKKIRAILDDPYHNTEPLQKRPHGDLRGIRSKRIDRNFRILFSICEECRGMFPDLHDKRACRSCDPDFPGNTVVFFAVQPHNVVYDASKPLD